MICQIQISRSNIGRGEMGEGRRGRRRDIKCLDKGRDLHGAIMMDGMIHNINWIFFRKITSLTRPACQACVYPPCGPRTVSGPGGPRTVWRSPGAQGGSRQGWPPWLARTAS